MSLRYEEARPVVAHHLERIGLGEGGYDFSRVARGEIIMGHRLVARIIDPPTGSTVPQSKRSSRRVKAGEPERSELEKESTSFRMPWRRVGIAREYPGMPNRGHMKCPDSLLRTCRERLEVRFDRFIYESEMSLHAMPRDISCPLRNPARMKQEQRALKTKQNGRRPPNDSMP